MTNPKPVKVTYAATSPDGHTPQPIVVVGAAPATHLAHATDLPSALTALNAVIDALTAQGVIAAS